MSATEKKITKAYIKHTLEHGHAPTSIYKFAKSIKMEEKEFYEFFNSFPQIEKAVWKSFIVDTLEQIQKEKVYIGYSMREKLLTFHYTLVENLLDERSYLLMSSAHMAKPITAKSQEMLSEAKKVFKDYAAELIMEGRETHEVEDRPVPQIMQRYPDMLWMGTKGVLEFWLSDESKAFEKTDTMIEKSVNTTMDLIGRSPLDSLFDLGKFMYQNGKTSFKS